MRRGPAALLMLVMLGALALPLWLGQSHHAEEPHVVADSIDATEATNDSDASLPGGPGLQGVSHGPSPTELPDDPHVVRWRGSPGGTGCDLEVRVQMPNGTPLGGMLVTVKLEVEERPSEIHSETHFVELQGRTDRKGQARFAGLPKQTVLCEASLVESKVREWVALHDGTVVVTLQSAPGLTYVHGTVRRGGQTVADRIVLATGKDADGEAVWAQAPTDADGGYHLTVPPGSYRLLVEGAASDYLLTINDRAWWQSGSSGPWIAGGDLDVDGDPPVIERDLELPPTSIELHVRPPEGSKLVGGRALVYLDDDPDTVRASLSVPEDGRVTFLDLPFGDVAISVVAEGAARWTGHLELSVANPTHRRHVSLEAGGSIRVVVKDPEGSAIDSNPRDPVFVEHLATGTRVRMSEWTGSRPMRVILFENLPLGRTRVFVDTPETQHGRRHGRLVAPDPVVVDVVPGLVDVILEDVRLPAHVVIKAKPPDGQHDRWAHVSVEDVDGLRMAPSKPDASHWNGYLPPGTYRVTLNDGWTGTWEETIEVGTDDVERTFEAPR